jgi:hypothetical protein
MVIGKLTGIKLVMAGALACLALGVAGAVPARAEGEAPSPWWHLDVTASPADLQPGGYAQIEVMADNLGDGEANGEVTPIVVSAKLPAGVVPVAIEGSGRPFGSEEGDCSVRTVSCTFTHVHAIPYRTVAIFVEVRIEPTAVSGVAEAVAEGGGAPRATSTHFLTVGQGPTPYGVESFEMVPEAVGGAPATQAGSHPFQFTTTLNLNRTAGKEGEVSLAGGLAKDLYFHLPAGVFGNPTVLPECTNAQFALRLTVLANDCPSDTVIGVAITTGFLPGGPPHPLTLPLPVFNMVPQPGEPARFAFELDGTPIVLNTAVRTGGDYGVVVSVDNITQVAELLGSEVTLWGVPGDPRHNSARNWGCLQIDAPGPCEPLQESGAPPPFLTLPDSCTTPWSPTVSVDSWEEPFVSKTAAYTLHDQYGHPLTLSGCNRLTFEPKIIAIPDAQEGSTPTGLTVDIHVPQDANLNPTGDAEAIVRDSTVTLPAGVALNPAGADGLSACGESEVGLESPLEQTCPESSKVGTVEIKTPLLPNPLVGAAYLATQDANPFGSLVALYLVTRDPVSGVLVKIAGQVTPNPVTGQLVATFDNTPQLPFEDLALNFFGGSRAPLATPALCGTYTTNASFAPWSETAPVESSSEFQITSGPNHTPCSDPLPFDPSLTAGSTNIQTGTFSQFIMTMSREDGNQNLDAIKIDLPEGLAGSLSEVKLCGEAQADAGTCGPESLIGTTTTSVGLGGNPYTVNGGQVFITGPYEGAPFGLSIVNPAKAGPFNLGKIIVRAKVEVNPVTSALTITTDTTGPYSIPQIFDGIPLEIKHLNVLINRPRFTFNPTNCTPTAITGSLTSSEGAVSELSVPFQVTNCATLEFKPGFSVSTAGKTSKASGASLDVHLTYPIGEGQANIRKVKVELPKQLPSRLTTLQKACTETAFDTNPESCPAASRIGEAVATTPVIAGDFTGPAYFVSNGGAKFPELVIVLTGEDGVKIDLHGETFINKQGITSSTFNAIPDVPVGSFELKLPQGPYSALAANGNLCKQKLAMPTEFVAQNGAVIHQSTKIAVTGCPKKARKASSHRGRGGKARAKGKRKKRG